MSEENTDLPKDEPELKTFTQEQVDSMIAEQVSGLKTKVDQLLGEKKGAQEKERIAQEEARIKAEELARKSGDAEALEKSLSERFSVKELEYQEKLAQRDALLLGERKNADTNELLSLFTQEGRAIGKQLLGSMLEASYNEDGKPITSLKGFDGSVVTTQLDAMKEHLKTNETFKSLLVGTQMDGGGATGNTGNRGAGGVPKTLEECKGDRKLEAQYFNTQLGL